MTIREQMEAFEKEYYDPSASFSIHTRGRDVQEEQCDIRTVYQRDRDRILHCKAFRRLKHKTQVFLTPQGDHYRTRLTHTLEVSQIARTIASALRLNESLTEAIALGHDLGHTPFGHAGEAALNQICPDGFAHDKQSVRVVEVLEKKGKGLNLTWEVRDGILNHRTSGRPSTLEGKVVRLADKIAYINHDIDDAERAGILSEDELPLEYRKVLGFNIRERLNTLIYDIILNSQHKGDIVMSQSIETAMKGLRRFMFANVYNNPEAKGEESKAKKMIQSLYQYYIENINDLPSEYRFMIEELEEKKERVVCDYIAGMTDQYAISSFHDLFVPNAWHI
ncbi:MAG TPA: deoxyguanosinetriphosphate triphosphohydrolase [Candidatus Merdenecus merdavium]|nr:deoxyguanosinetriphosphate triphosphohydrolase [Candidatus Merdenecus merdavium]